MIGGVTKPPYTATRAAIPAYAAEILAEAGIPPQRRTKAVWLQLLADTTGMLVQGDTLILDPAHWPPAPLNTQPPRPPLGGRGGAYPGYFQVPGDLVYQAVQHAHLPPILRRRLLNTYLQRHGAAVAAAVRPQGPPVNGLGLVLALFGAADNGPLKGGVVAQGVQGFCL